MAIRVKGRELIIEGKETITGALRAVKGGFQVGDKFFPFEGEEVEGKRKAKPRGRRTLSTRGTLGAKARPTRRRRGRSLVGIDVLGGGRLSLG